MPIYEYGCKNCGWSFEVICKVSSESWKKEKNKPIICEKCGKKEAYKLASSFKIGSACLDTSKLTGYDDDDLTLGKIIDEGGIPYEYKDDIRKQEKRSKDRKEYIKGLKERGKKYGFDPFSDKDEKLI